MTTAYRFRHWFLTFLQQWTEQHYVAHVQLSRVGDDLTPSVRHGQHGPSYPSSVRHASGRGGLLSCEQEYTAIAGHSTGNHTVIGRASPVGECMMRVWQCLLLGGSIITLGRGSLILQQKTEGSLRTQNNEILKERAHCATRQLRGIYPGTERAGDGAQRSISCRSLKR